MVIPKTAVLWTGKKAIVYVKKPNTNIPAFVFREIILGEDAGNFYVVASGLQEGEEIATHGVFKIDAAAQLAGKQSMMNMQEEKTEEHQHHNSNRQEVNADKAKFATTQFKVFGNCELCKGRIEESALATHGVKKAIWDVDSRMIVVKYDKSITSQKKIVNAIVNAGHDTEYMQAEQATYDELPECCQYARKK